MGDKPHITKNVKIFLYLLAILALCSFVIFYGKDHGRIEKKTSKRHRRIIKPLKTAVANSNTPTLTSAKKTKFVGFAPHHVHHAQLTPIFNVSQQPPAGFLSLSAPQPVLVDIYYQGKFLGVAKASVAPNALRFANPAHITNLLHKNLINSSVVQKTLTGQIATNTRYLCDKVRTENCNVLFPKVASVLYDPTSFRAYVFVNPSLTKHHIKSFLTPLAPSTSGFSYINQLYAVTSNTTGKYGYNDYNLTSNNTWSYKNTRLNLSASYANNLIGKTSLQIDNANFAMTKDQHQYIFGMLDTLGNAFFANQTILGGEFQTTLDTIPKAADGIGTPINISLNFPSQVSVYKDGKLIYTGRYQAGNQSLDTSQFPTGSYPIVIRITNGQGISREIRQFFVKTTQLAPLHMPQYYASAGYLMGNRQYDSGMFTKLLSIPVYQAGTNIRLLPNWGMNVGILGTNRNLFSKIGVMYLQEHWSLQPAFLVGAKGETGYSGTLSYQNNRFSTYANVAQIWHQHQDVTAVNTRNDYYYRFLNLNTLQLDFNANYQFDKSNIALFMTLNRSRHQPETYSYGPSFTTELLRRGNTIVNFNLSAAKSEHDYFVFATVRVNFVSQQASGYGAIGYNATKSHTNNDLTGRGISADGAINWNHMDATQRGYNFGVNAAANPIANNIGTTYDYQNDRMQLTTFGNYNNTKENGTFGQYGGSFNTHLIYTPSNMALSGGNIDANTGVLVVVKSKNPSDTFDIYVNARLVKHVKAGEKVFVSLEPFNRYQVSVVNTSAALYHFATPERKITIYKGNVQDITWHAVRKYIIVGRLLAPNKKPIKYAIIHDGIGYNTTDDKGYFRLETNANVHSFTVTNHHRCKFNIPHFQVYNNFHYVNDVICYPIGGESAQKLH